MGEMGKRPEANNNNNEKFLSNNSNDRHIATDSLTNKTKFYQNNKDITMNTTIHVLIKRLDSGTLSTKKNNYDHCCG